MVDQLPIPAEFRAEPGAHWPAIGAFAGVALLAAVGFVWLMIKPGAFDVGRVLTALFLALFGLGCAVGAYAYWVRLHRRYELRMDGLLYFDGRQEHEIAWSAVTEMYETVTSVKLLGLTVDAPQLDVLIVTSDGVRCRVDKNIRGADQLAPLVSRAVNRRLEERARKQLERRQPVAFGDVRLSQSGVAIDEPRPKPWWEVLRHRFESNVNSDVVVPGEYTWPEVRDIRVASARRGERLADHTTYSELQVHVQGRNDPVLVRALPEFPNFAVFCLVLDALGRPLTHDS